MNVITSSEDGEDRDDDRYMGENVVSRHVTRGAGTSKLRASAKSPMIGNLEKRVFRLEELIKDIIDFMKEERLRRAKKEKQKKRDKDEAVVENKNPNEGDEEKEEEKNEEAICEKK
ncbi:hypothetical protein FXO37_19177 [Capsicum annuum]|nr:hypothetical protein FXO37_19177 [Capsicum annuum]